LWGREGGGGWSVVRCPLYVVRCNGCGCGLGGGNAVLVALAGGEAGGRDLDGLEQEAGALEVHVVAGEAGGDIADGLLDGVVVEEVFEEEGIVFEDGADVVATVLVAHELVVHGAAAAAGAILLREVHALMGFGWLAVEVGIGYRHRVPPPVSTRDSLMRLELHTSCLLLDTLLIGVWPVELNGKARHKCAGPALFRS